MTVSPVLRQRWKSGDHVGAAKPVLRGYIRTVQLGRNWRAVSQENVYSFVPGWWGGNKIWHGRWRARTGWKALPNILSANVDQDFDQNGVANAVIEIDNLELVEEEGVGGIFHSMHRGYFAPFAGGRATALGLPPTSAKNEWFDVLSDKSSQIILLAGYGDQVTPIFEGLVNDCDMTSRPDRIVLTCRDSGQVLTDQPVFLNAKARHVPDPITFCDRRQADETEEVALGVGANTASSGHPPRFAIDGNQETNWISRDYEHATPVGNLPYIEISVPNGRYETVKLHPRFDGMTAFVAILARDKNAPGGQGARKVRGDLLPDNNWVNEGIGQVPGTSVPYVRRFENLAARERVISLPDFGYQLGDDSKIRIYFNYLSQQKASNGKGRAFKAGMIEMKAIRRTLKDEAKQKRWILVDDLADVVRTVFQWCGLNAWEVETTGVRLKEKTTFNRGHYLIDIINAASEQVGYVFYIKPREEFDEEDLGEQGDIENSMGIAVWRQSNALRTGNGVRDPVEVIHEDQTLTGIDMKWTDEPLAFNIRVRGRRVNRKKRAIALADNESAFGNNRGPGRTLGSDRTKRWMYVYQPPWSRGAFQAGEDGGDYRNGNIKKYVVHHDNKLRNLAECKVAALLIAYQEAMEAGQAQFEAPCMPSIFLDHQCALFDTGTGLSTRVYVASRQISWRGGENAEFKMALGGSLLDLPDITTVRTELIQVLRDIGYDPGINRWESEKYGNVYRNNP